MKNASVESRKIKRFNFNGFRASHRNRWLLLEHRILDGRELLLWEFLIDQMDFDARHPKVGMFEFYPDEVAEIFAKKSSKTMDDWFRGLVEKGFVGLVDKTRSLYEIAAPTRYSADTRIGGKAASYVKEEMNYNLEELFTSWRVNFPKEEKNPQKDRSRSYTNNNGDSRSLGSSKGKSIGNIKKVVIKQEVLSDGEYQRICDGGGYKLLTPEDMRWIDENIEEIIEIRDKTDEEEVTRLYFDGDHAEYKKRLITE